MTDDPAGLALRETILPSNALYCLPSPFGSYKFPEATSFITCFSSDRSAIYQAFKADVLPLQVLHPLRPIELKAAVLFTPAIELCCKMPALRQATGAALHCGINTSIWRSCNTIYSALNLFLGITKAPFQAQFLTKLGPKKPGQVTRHVACHPQMHRCERYILSQIVTNRDVLMYRFDSVCFGRAG